MRFVRISSGYSSFAFIQYNNQLSDYLSMFYFTESQKIKKEIVRVQPKQNLSRQYMELIRLKQARDKLIYTSKRQQEQLNRKQTILRQKEEYLQRCLEMSKQELLKLEISELRRYCQEYPQIKEDAKYRISQYLQGFHQFLQFSRMRIFGSSRIYQKVKIKIRNRATKKYLTREISKILTMEKISYRSQKLMMTIKRIEGEKIEVSIYSYSKTQTEKPFTSKLITRFDSIYTKSVPPLYNIFINETTKEINLLCDFICCNQPLWLRIIKFCSRLKTHIKVRNYLYIKKRLVTIFYQNQINKSQPIKPLWILVTVNKDRLLILQSFSQGDYIYIKHQFPQQVTNIRQEVTTFLSEHSISYKQNRLLRKLDYEKIRKNVVKIQSKFRSHTQSKRFRSSGPKAQVRLVSSEDRRSFVSCIFGGNCETVYFEGYNKTTIAYQFDKRYSPLLHKAMRELSPSSVTSLEEFNHFITQIEQRIKLFEQNSEAIFKSMPFEFFERLRRFFFRIKIRSLIKRKQYKVMKISLNSSLMVLIIHMAQVTLDFIEAHFYQLLPTSRPRRQHSFLISKYLHGEVINTQKVPKMFHISENLCVVSPPRIKGRHYILWLKEFFVTEGQLLAYNIFVEKKVFFAQVYMSIPGSPLLEVDCKQFSRKDLMEMTQFQIEAEISAIYRAKYQDVLKSIIQSQSS